MKGNDFSLAYSFEKSINGDVKEMICDLAEIGLDAVMDDGLLRDIPIISTVVATYKIGNTLKERSYVKKLATFIEQINQGIVDEKQRQQYIREIRKDKEKSQHEIELILLLIDRYVQPIKSVQLGKLYIAYLDGIINWVEFCQYSEVLDRLFPNDEYYLTNDFLIDKNRDELSECALQRLQGLGMVLPNMVPGTFDVNGNVLSKRIDGTYERTLFGEKFFKIIMQNN